MSSTPKYIYLMWGFWIVLIGYGIWRNMQGVT